MRAIVTFLAVVAAVVWSIVVWGSYLVVMLTTEFLAGPSGDLYLPPEIGQVATWVGSLLDNYGSGTALVVWLLGIGLVLLVRKLLHGLVSRAKPEAVTQPPDGRVQPALDRPIVRENAPNPAVWGRDASRR